MTNIELLDKTDRKILTLLPLGSERPRTSEEIATLLNMNKRRVFERINRLIVKHGYPIVASRQVQRPGYFLAQDLAELLAGIRELQAQHNSESERLNALINADITEALENIKKVVDVNV